MSTTATSFNQVLSNTHVIDFCFTPDGGFLYLTDQGEGGKCYLTVYSVDQVTGSLHSVQGPVALEANSNGRLVMHPSGSWLIVEEYAFLVTFSVSTDGKIEKVARLPASPNLFDLRMHSSGETLYALEIPQSHTTNLPSSVYTFTFDTSNGSLTRPENSTKEVGLGVSEIALSGDELLFCLALGIGPEGQKGYVKSFALEENGCPGSLVDQKPTTTSRPSCMSLESGVLYIGENTPATNPDAHGPVALTVFSVSESGAMTELSDSPYTPPDNIGPNAVLATSGSLYAVGSSGFYSDSKRHLWVYGRNSTTGTLTLKGNGLHDLAANPVKLLLHPASRLVYINLLGNAGGLFTYQTDSPLFGGSATLEANGVNLSARTSSDVELKVKLVGFYYGTSYRPTDSDTTFICELVDNQFETTLKFSQIRSGTTYYSRPFLQLESGETYLGNISSFQVNYPTVTGISPEIAGVGQTLTIEGKNFSSEGSTTVTFMGLPPSHPPITVTAHLNESGQLVLPVPSGAYDGPIFVTSNGLPGPPSRISFFLQEVPEIAPGSDFYGVKGAQLNFRARYIYVPPEALVNFGEVSVPIRTGGHQSVSVTVGLPENIVTGPITVTSHGVTSAPSDWTVYPYSLTSAGLSGVAQIVFGGGQYLALTHDGTLYSNPSGVGTWSKVTTFDGYSEFLTLYVDQYGVCWVTAVAGGQGYILWGTPGQSWNGLTSQFSNITRLTRTVGEIFMGLEKTSDYAGYLITGQRPDQLTRLPDFPENWEVIDLVYADGRLVVIGGDPMKSTVIGSYYSDGSGYEWTPGGDFPEGPYLSRSTAANPVEKTWNFGGELKWDPDRSLLISTYGFRVVGSYDLGETWKYLEAEAFTFPDRVVLPMSGQLAVAGLSGIITISKEVGEWHIIEENRPTTTPPRYILGATNGQNAILVDDTGESYEFKAL